MTDQWPRALLRAELLEAGYDAVGARTFDEALALVFAGPERGPVRLVVAEQAAVEGMAAGGSELAGLGAEVIRVLLAKTGGALPPGPWNRVLRRPASIGDIVAAVRASVPLAVKGASPIE